ncbi:MAG: RluA family pseudouridine synthase [Vicinamibacteria bacterium]
MSLNQGYAYRETLGPAARRLTVLEYLSHRYRHSSPDEWRSRIDDGLVFLDGRPADRREVLRLGQTLVWHRPPWQEPPAPLDFAVLYEDEHLLAVAKPAGLPTLPGGGFLNHTLLARVRGYCAEASPLHRLGRGTSGVMLWARTGLARQRLSSAWRTEVRRVYRTLVQGLLKDGETTIEIPIGLVPHPLLGTVFAATPRGKPSLSRVRLLERRRDTSLVEVELLTGRPHQIRIHLAAAGHPLIGDPLYAIGGVPKSGSRALPGDLGYLLHAERVGFPHPQTGRPLEVTCLPPPSLRDFLTV